MPSYLRCTSVQSYEVSTALLYRVAHLCNLLRSPISIGSEIKSYRPKVNRMGGMVSEGEDGNEVSAEVVW